MALSATTELSVYRMVCIHLGIQPEESLDVFEDSTEDFKAFYDNSLCRLLSTYNFKFSLVRRYLTLAPPNVDTNPFSKAHNIPEDYLEGGSYRLIEPSTRIELTPANIFAGRDESDVNPFSYERRLDYFLSNQNDVEMTYVTLVPLEKLSANAVNMLALMIAIQIAESETDYGSIRNRLEQALERQADMAFKELWASIPAQATDLDDVSSGGYRALYSNRWRFSR